MPLGAEELVSAEAIPSFCPYTSWEAALRLASAFRIFASDGQDFALNLPSGAQLLQSGERVQQQRGVNLAALNVRAKAWVSTVLGEMNQWKTGSFRAKWFGGSGGLSDSAVRQRIQLTMNFIERELGAVRYVYPADGATNSICGGQVLGYVWKSGSSSSGYSETRGPACSSGDDPYRKPCGRDQAGKYIVYLCNYWASSSGLGDNVRVATLVHEAAHHTGPRDVTYDKQQMQRMSQSQQLDNAASYQNFAEDVARTVLCMDSDPNCNVYASQGYCSADHIKALCKETCGQCGGAPSPQACVDTDGACAYYQRNGYCSTQNVANSCKKTCGFCR
jgi:hypothetical protein